MPQINMLIELINWLLLDFNRTNALGLNALGAFQDVLDADFVRWKGRTSSPIPAHPIDHKVIGELGDSRRKVHLGLWVELVGHRHAVDAYYLAALG